MVRLSQMESAARAGETFGLFPPCPLVLSLVHGQPRCGFAPTTPNFSDRIDQSDNDLVYSVGVGLTFVHRFNQQLEYEILDISEFDDSDAYWLNASWRF